MHISYTRRVIIKGLIEKVDMTNETKVDMVNHPPHYTRGPKILIGDNPATTGRDTMDWLKPTVEHGRRIFIEISCIEVIRWITDVRLATAMKYIWRVAFGGKDDGTTNVEDKKKEDIEKAIWYLRDWLDNPVNAAPVFGAAIPATPTPGGVTRDTH